MADIENVIKNGQEDSVNQAFRDGAELIVPLDSDGNVRNMAWISLGSSTYFFAGEPVMEDGELMDGTKITKLKLPYDGWERHLGATEDSYDETQPPDIRVELPPPNK